MGASKTHPLTSEIRLALTELPTAVKDLVNERLAGIFLVENLGGTAYSDYILDSSGTPVAAFVILDTKVLLKRTANSWATWKEASPFSISDKTNILAKIEIPSQDNRKNAIQYIILHELGHVASIGRDFHPYWGISPKSIKNEENYPFLHQSWRINRTKNSFESIFDHQIMSKRRDIVYYFGARLGAEDIPSMYRMLINTNFVTLYAATNPYDDWAESFATYVHSVLMGKPFSVEIREGRTVVETFSLCWGTERCRKKEAILSKLLRVPN